MFEHAALTVDDVNRASAYQAELRRAETIEKVGNYEEYLASLKMRMTIATFDKLGRARIVQLVSKSNQFNLATRRYNELQLAKMESDPRLLTWQVRLRDTYGDHGMIAVVIVRKCPLSWDIDTWLMSCRVLERGVEHALMNELVATAVRSGVECITGAFFRTARNALVEKFLEHMQFKVVSTGPSEKRYALTVADYVPFPSTIVISVAGNSTVLGA